MNLHFVLCLERTGSSMLAAMLNASPKVIAPSEEPFLLYFKKKYGSITNWTDAQLISFASDFFLLHDKNLSVYFNTREDFIDTLLNSEREVSFLDICKIVYLNFYPHKDKSAVTTIVDKQIKYSYLPEKISRISPSSKFVILTRNPLDNLASWKKRGLGKAQDGLYLSEVWRDIYSILHEFHQDRANITMHVKYEDLVNQPEKTLHSICDFLSIEFQVSMLNFNENFGQFTKESSDQDQQFIEKLNDFHSGLHQPINHENINIYDQFFNQRDIDLISLNCEKAAANFGYKLPTVTTKNIRLSSFKRFRSRWSRRYILKVYYLTPIGIKKFFRKIRKKKVVA